MNPALIILIVVATYAVAGLPLAVALVAVGLRKIDPVAAHAPLRVRLLFLPGCLALWPLLMLKWARFAQAPSPEHAP